MTAWEKRMRAALIACEAQFRAYADHHLTKEPPDRDKAAINLEWSRRCLDAATEPNEARP